MSKRYVVGITGATGAIYARRVIETLAADAEVFVVASDAGRRVMLEEIDARMDADDPRFADWLGLESDALDRVHWFPVRDIGAGPASGSWPHDGMAIVPCSMRSLAAVACGLADNLLTRSADVCLKEHRRLVLVPRECPQSVIHLENQLKLAQAGARIVPPAPGFYQRPKTIEDVVEFVVGKIVQQVTQ